MTVAQLIHKLQKMPQDYTVTMSNNDLYINGDYGSHTAYYEINCQSWDHEIYDPDGTEKEESL